MSTWTCKCGRILKYHTMPELRGKIYKHIERPIHKKALECRRAAAGAGRYIVKEAKGLFGAIRWHVWDTLPDYGYGGSVMEADDRKSCKEYARELNTRNVERERRS